MKPTPLDFARAAQAAYLNNGGFFLAMDELELESIGMQSGMDDVEWYFGQCDNLSVLAFRGTSSLHDWLTDASADQMENPLGDGRLHEGFCRAMQAVWREVLDAVSKKGPIYVTGHSMGGALATIAGDWLAVSGVPVLKVFTFGSPKTGNVVWRDNYIPEMRRYANGRDIVPHVPFDPTLWGLRLLEYKHVGQPIMLPAGSAWPDIADCRTDDHPIEKYIAALNT